MKFEEQTNISAYVLDCIEKELGYLEKIKSPAGPEKLSCWPYQQIAQKTPDQYPVRPCWNTLYAPQICLLAEMIVARTWIWRSIRNDKQ